MHKGGNPSLPSASQQWPASTTRDHKNAAKLKKAKGGRDLSKETALWAGSKEKRRLNPRFTAWLMGWLEDADLRCSGATGSTVSGSWATE